MERCNHTNSTSTTDILEKNDKGERETSICFDNPGFRSDIREDGIPMRVIRPGRDEDQDGETYRQRHYAHRKALALQHHTRTTRKKRTNCCGFARCVNAGVIILLFASITSSAYVFHQYMNQETHSCTTPRQASPLSTKDQENKKLVKSFRRLKDEVGQLSEQVIHFIKSNTTKCQPTNLREERRRSAMLRRQANNIERGLDIIKTNLTNKIDKVDKEVQLVKTSMNELGSKISNISKRVQLQTNIGKCVFKTQLSKTTETFSMNQTVSIVERQSGNFIGVTCCAVNYQPSQNYSSSLSVQEEQGNMTYSCHCLNSKQCHLCYWECS